MHFDATMVAAIAFGVFIGILLWAKVPGTIMKALDDQSAAIAKELDEARRLRAEAEALRASYAAQEANAKAEAAALIAKAREDAERLRAEAKAAEEAAIAEVRAAASSAALDVAEKVLVATTKGKVAADLLTKSLGEVGNRLS